MAYRVLLVDDSATTRELIARTLEIAGIEVETVHQAGNGKEALEVLRNNWVDLVFADINMPVMNGIDMIEHMKDDPVLASVPIVVVSTDGSATRVEQLSAKGIKAYLRKPFTPEQLRAVVDSFWGEVPVIPEQKQVVIRGFSGVLEKMAFMFAEPVDTLDQLKFGAESLRRARMHFSGVLNGTFDLVLPKVLCIEIAANMLGKDLDDPGATARGDDAFRELLNVVCGQILTSLVGERPMFTLTVPEAAEIEPGELQRLMSDVDSAGFLVEGSPILLRFKLEQPA